ncbi:MAG: SUMF1/EgtB/PvdO family nonheme iron enzyme [Deltaproteobacteria bacterium]|nr:SUMF1/EgtB/PvdO family nonheme iron enzyme [Deltaproteobacteria bacterium]
MSLGPSDRALAAHLIRSSSVPLRSILQALRAAVEEDRAFGELLLETEALTPYELEFFRNDLEPPPPPPSGHVSLLEASTISDDPAEWDADVLGATPTLMRLGHDDPKAQGVLVEPSSAPTVASIPPEGATVRVGPSPSSPSTPPSSKTPNDARYLCGREIGRGGMGRVLLAKDRSIGRDVAVKVLLESHESDETQVRRFWMEVKANGRLEHPSIVPIHDVGRLDSGQLFYVMKLLEGRTLAEILMGLRSEDEQIIREFPQTRLLTAFQQLAYAVAFAHARGFLHRDIKPANIMVGDFGEVTLLDWGLAKPFRSDASVSVRDPAEPPPGAAGLSSSDTASGTIVGTPQYMSPEAANGETRLTDRADVYCLGEILYEILTLAPAYSDEGVLSTLMRVRSGEIMPPRQRSPERRISVELDEVCMAALAKAPTDRPTAKMLADAVGEILEGSRARERRRAEAKGRIGHGERVVERLHALKQDLARAEAEARRLEKTIPPHAAVEEKRILWALEDRARELRVEAVASFAEAESCFQGALADVADDVDARAGLASLYAERFADAEKAHDREGQRYYAGLAARYDDGRLAPLLAGRGVLEVTTSPYGVEVLLERYVEKDRVLAPAEPRRLGRTPIPPLEVPIGSYRLVAEAPGYPRVIYPVQIARLSYTQAHVVLRSADAIGDGFVLVPGGSCVLGGDPVAHGALERRVKVVPEFAISRAPVTCGEYLAFVNDLARKSVDESRRRVPRVSAGEGHYWSYDSGRATWLLPEKALWSLDYPVFGVSFEDAVAYCEWLSLRTGQKLRLPHEDEWEKSARGVDERFFPWGDHFDATFCKMKDSRGTAHSEPEPVGSYPFDRSPYGVEDMAGGVRELCVTELEGERVPVMRGGCWHDTGLFCRVAFRHLTKPHFVNTGLGFRVAKTLQGKTF